MRAGPAVVQRHSPGDLLDCPNERRPQLDSTLWLCVGSALRVLFPQHGVYFQPVPFA